jgi:CO/xanthine dehydrogenase Mo-binding subunit
MAAHIAVSRAVAHAIKREVVTYPLSPERVKELVKR